MKAITSRELELLTTFMVDFNFVGVAWEGEYIIPFGMIGETLLDMSRVEFIVDSPTVKAWDELETKLAGYNGCSVGHTTWYLETIKKETMS